MTGLSFLLLLVIGVPIAFALIAFAMIMIWASGNPILFQSFPQQFFGGLENYGLLALPLFILLGEFMNAGGIGRRLMNVAVAMLGPVKGGLAYVNLVANMMMASILGSTVAQITIMSRVAVPEMERTGYPRDVSVAITAAGGMLAPIIPPSMLFIGMTLLHKSGDGRGSPFPGRTYPTASVTGMPSAVYPFRTAIRTWSSAT